VTVRRRVAGWFERVLLGTVMNLIAFIIERRVLKAIRGADGEPPQSAREDEFPPGGHGPAGQG
jgi:hypothetical protein